MLSNIIDRIKLPFRKEKELYLSLFKILGFYPHDISYYKLALKHKSVANRNIKGKPANNERLEFLGDAVLGAIVGDIVYEHFPGKREGFLTNTRSKIVQRDTLNRLAKELGISQLILSSGQGMSHNSYMEGNAFEALMGAIYLDRGYNACMRFIEKRILKTMINIDKVAYKEVNFKSKLIEWSQKNKIKLDFELVNQGKDAQGSPFFVYKVLLEGVEAGQGKGYSKKESQQLASKETLKQLKRLPQFIDAVFAAKAERTKMEEEPVQMVPDVDDNNEKVDTDNNKTPKKNSNIAVNDDSIQKTIDSDGSEFDLSDINVAPELKTREDIIAAAEEQAYKDN
ncbi:MAG: ribonuclease III [Prevotella sp.]|nr:ribonuclease III [Prevotella sp.]